MARCFRILAAVAVLAAAGCSAEKSPGNHGEGEPPDGKLAVALNIDALAGDAAPAGAALFGRAATPWRPAGATVPRVPLKYVTLEGFRLRLREVVADGPAVERSAVLDFTAAPRLIEAATGYSEQVTGSGRIAPGEYTGMAIHLDNWFAVKGYAFLPIYAGLDPVTGSAMTLWTTAAGIVTAPGMVAPAHFTSYGYWEGAWPEGATESQESGVARVLTAFADPVSVAADAGAVAVSLRLNTARLLMAIDGEWSARNEPGASGATYIRPYGRLTGFAFLNAPEVIAETYEWIEHLPAEGPTGGEQIFHDPWLDGARAFTLVLTPGGEPIMGQMHYYALFQTITGAVTNADGSYRLMGAPAENAPAGQGAPYLDGFKRLQVGDAPIPVTLAFWNGTSLETETRYMRRVAR